MSKFSLKIAYPIIITGLFVIVVVVMANHQILTSDFYIILIPLTAFLFLFGFATGQRFALPVKELLKDADYFSKGNYKIRFNSKTQDELGELAKIFNKIAEEFEDSKSKIESLDSKVKLRTKALEEIINVLEDKVKNRNLEFQGAIDDLGKAQTQISLKETEIVDLKNQINRLTAQKTKSRKV